MRGKNPAKLYLLQIAQLDKMIENKLADRQRWWDTAISATAQMSGELVQSSSNQQRMADAINEYIDIENDNDGITALRNKRKEIISVIEQLPLDEYDVLHKVYVQRMTYQQVADAYDLSYSWATTTHGRALRHVRDILQKKQML